MLRTIALLSVTATFIACSGNSNGNNGNGNNNGGSGGNGGGADMATGTGGNGGGGGSGGGSGNTDGGMLPDLAGLPAPDHDPKQHPPVPTMGQYYNTMSTFTAPVVYPVVWTGEVQTNGKDTGAAVQAFLTDMMQSDYWNNAVKEYGAGKGTVKPVITLGQVPSTITDQQLQQTITSNLGKPGWPASGDKQAIVVFITDPTTTVTNQNASSCKDFGGYHSNSGGVFGGGTTYAVADYCYKQGTMMPDWDQFTFAISHEVAEAVTDYNLKVNRVVDGSGYPFLGGGEDGDMCLDLPSKQTWASGTYNVSRLWSNAVAMANNADPCIPNDQGPWFGAAFDSGDTSKPGELAIPLTNGAGQATFKILPFEYDPSVGPIAFYILGAVIPQGVTFDPDIAVKTDPTTGAVLSGHVMYANAGSTVTVTVKVDSTYMKPGPLQPATVQLLIVAHNEDKSRYNLWWADLAPQ